jgi:transcriptional regulator with XRE-family HTH domain
MTHIRDAMPMIRTQVQRLLGVFQAGLEEVGAKVGLSSSALRRYRLGGRTPDPMTALRLARALRAHARRLDQLARRLEHTATKEATNRRTHAT